MFITEFKYELAKNVNYDRMVWILMDDMLTQQLEALQVVAPYCARSVERYERERVLNKIFEKVCG